MDTADHNPASLPSATPEIEDKTSTIKSGNDPSCSTSESDTDSDGDGFFQIDAPEFPYLRPISTREDPLIHLLPNKIDDDSLVDTSGGGNEEWEAPAVQVMERNEVADPGRIPSSVFARSSPTPMEWSVASNESLFSITMGNMSLSGDQVFLMERSGDLGGFASGLMEYPPPPFPPGVSPGTAGENVRGAIVDLGTVEEAAATANAEAMRDVLRAAVEEKEREREKPAASALRGLSIATHSDGSTTSFRSFAFPILYGDGRIGSTKVESLHHIEFNPLSRAVPQKAALISAAPAAPAAPASSHGPAPASIQSLCSSCFSCCRC